MKNLFNRLASQVRRIKNARRFGVPFFRRSSFQIPSKIKINNSYHSIYAPHENGARVDFLMCLLDNGYGLSSIDKEHTTVLDIGANLGFFALAAKSRFPNAMIHCYEPNPRTFCFLDKNTENLDIIRFSEAIGGMNGYVYLEERGDCNQAKTTGTTSGISVPQIDLATAVKRMNGRVELAKIDCEGAEWEMFENPEPWQSIQELRIEYHLLDKYDSADVVQRLKNFDFKILRHFPEGAWGTIWATRYHHFR